MSDSKAEQSAGSPQSDKKIKDDSIASILMEANSIINEFEGIKPKEPPLKLCEGNEMNDAAKRAKMMMAVQQQQQLQARQQKAIPSPIKRKSPVSMGSSQNNPQMQRPPPVPRNLQQNVGDSGVNSNTMAQMLGVLMARVDFLEKDNTKSKEIVQRVKTLETSIEKISMIINKISGKIDNIPKGTTDATEALIKQVDVMKDKFNDSRALMQRVEKLEKHGGRPNFSTGFGEAGNETLLARVSTLEENVTTTTDRLVGLRIRTKSVMSRLDSLEDINRNSKSPNDNKRAPTNTKSSSNETTNELVMKVDYLEQLMNSIKGGRGTKTIQEPINQQVLMARVEALEEESRKKGHVVNRSYNRSPNDSARPNISPNIARGRNIKVEPYKSTMNKRGENEGLRNDHAPPKARTPKAPVNKRNSLDDVIDTGMILDLLEEIEQEKETEKPIEKPIEKSPSINKRTPMPKAPKGSDTSEDSGDESLSKYLSARKRSTQKSGLKNTLETNSVKQSQNRESSVEPVSKSNNGQNHNEEKQKAPVKISLKTFKKQNESGDDVGNRNGEEMKNADENNNTRIDMDEKERFSSSMFDALPLTSPTKDDTANTQKNLAGGGGMTTNKRAQKYFKKGGPRHKFFS